LIARDQDNDASRRDAEPRREKREIGSTPDPSARASTGAGKPPVISEGGARATPSARTEPERRPKNLVRQRCTVERPTKPATRTATAVHHRIRQSAQADYVSLLPRIMLIASLIGRSLVADAQVRGDAARHQAAESAQADFVSL
jgi:hypothetical protein